MKSSMIASKKFAETPRIRIPRSSFKRDHTLKTTIDSQYLYPILVDEIIPGDGFNVTTHYFGRLATPLYPLMDNLHFDLFYFFVPTRILFDNFKKMMGEQDNPADSVDFTIPQITPAIHTEGSLYDHLGVPFGTTNAVAHSNIPARCYNKIWNDWFRDENLQDSVTVDVDDGPDAVADYVLLKRGKRHDYFTSCLPWPQKADAVSLPLGTTAPVKGIGADNQNWSAGPQTVYETGETASTSFADVKKFGQISHDIYAEEDVDNAGFPGIYADLSNATAATINELRQAFAIQTLYERDARGGTRYVEIVLSHFGVSNAGGDARLQRAEYLGGTSNPVNISPVANQSSTTNPVGELAGIGTMSGQAGFTKSFTEHGTLMCLANCRGDITYQQGLNRMWSRLDKLDQVFPALSQLGEQAVLNKEIFIDGSANDEVVFGYQEAYAEMRYKPSEIHSAFRSNAATPLDAWHLAQEFATLPTLGATFIQDATPVSRVVATPSEPEIILDVFHSMACARPLPMFGIPATLGRF